MREEWRCGGCNKLLGIVRGGRLHLRFARGHEYLVGFPVTSVCRGCRTLNEAPHAPGDDVDNGPPTPAPSPEVPPAPVDDRRQATLR